MFIRRELHNKATIHQECDIKKYYRIKEILRGISIDLFLGEIVSMLGVNGAGINQRGNHVTNRAAMFNKSALFL